MGRTVPDIFPAIPRLTSKQKTRHKRYRDCYRFQAEQGKRFSNHKLGDTWI